MIIQTYDKFYISNNEHIIYCDKITLINYAL